MKHTPCASSPTTALAPGTRGAAESSIGASPLAWGSASPYSGSHLQRGTPPRRVHPPRSPPQGGDAAAGQRQSGVASGGRRWQASHRVG